ncbi:MAG TPA: hypothetical protein VHG51_13615 [Longimicrobiaceae bacterium]|nr:hypothetical protein [Longimicrobiaceae bacterium]
MSGEALDLAELRQALASVQKLRRSALPSILLMAAGVALLLGSVAYSLTRLRPLEREVQALEGQVAAKQRELRELEETTLRFADENRVAQERLAATLARIDSAQAQLRLVQLAPSPAARASALQDAALTIRSAERTAVGAIPPGAAARPLPEATAAGAERRRALVAGLFAERSASRIRAYDALIAGYRNDPALVPELLAYARANPDNLNGIYNTLVVLARLDRRQVRPHAAEVRAFLGEVRPRGERIAERADIVARRVLD